MRIALFAAAALAFAAGAPARAQMMSGDDADAQMGAMQAAMAQAEADAVRPGDEDMDCDALFAEMTATMQDPAVQAQIAAGGEWAAAQQGKISNGHAAMAGMVGLGIVSGLASSFIPGAGYASSMMMQAQAGAMQAQAAQNQNEMMAQAQGMQAIMPQLMRGQRLYELGQAKQCAWVEETPAP